MQILDAVVRRSEAKAPMDGQQLLEADFDEVFTDSASLWEHFRGARIFITGGTGFFGSLLIESLLWANARFSLGAQAVLLTRDPAAYARRHPRLATNPAIRVHAGDVRDFAYPEGRFTHVIHAATPAVEPCDPLDLVDTIVGGTRRALEFARIRGAKRFLLTSSGAVYGRQPEDIMHVREDFAGAPDSTDLRSVYGESKRQAELLCAIYAAKHLVETVVARCFAFVGPYLPLDAHFAIGNFIRDALAGGDLNIRGDGTPYRSYLYGSDLSAWLWTLLADGAPGRAYNVGSAQAYSIAEIAHEVVRAIAPAARVIIARPPVAGASPERYIPSVERAQVELGLRQTVDLTEAIRRTARWYSTAGDRPL